MYIDDCISATSSMKEELTHFITSASSFHPARKYIWKILKSSVVFLDIKVSINAKGLSIIVYYKAYRFPLLFVTFIFSSFPRQRLHPVLNFLDKSEEMCQFFKKRGYPDFFVNTAQHRTRKFDRQTALQLRHIKKRKRENSICTISFKMLSLR